MMLVDQIDRWALDFSVAETRSDDGIVGRQAWGNEAADDVEQDLEVQILDLVARLSSELGKLQARRVEPFP